jgi:NlpC/P60 family putative phage cell wall peptidase
VTTNSDIVDAARGWLGTPYHHQAAVRGVGCDCLGLVRGVWREVTGSEAETPPAYSPDWAEAARRETLIEAARRHLMEIGPGDIGPGDVLVFRLRPGAMAKHAGILTGPDRMIHACSGRAVAEIALGPWWRRRLAAAFRFPGVAT